MHGRARGKACNDEGARREFFKCNGALARGEFFKEHALGGVLKLPSSDGGAVDSEISMWALALR